MTRTKKLRKIIFLFRTKVSIPFIGVHFSIDVRTSFYQVTKRTRKNSILWYMAIISSLTSFAFVLSLFFTLFLLFGYSRAETSYSIWILIIFLATIVLSMISSYRDQPSWSTQQSVLLGQYL